MTKGQTCNVPQCEKAANGPRGLCLGHYQTMLRRPSGTAGKEIAKFAAPRKRNQKRAWARKKKPAEAESAEMEADAAAVAGVDVPEDPDAVVRPGGGQVEGELVEPGDEECRRLIATVCEVCTALGCQRIDRPGYGERVFSNPRTDKLVALTDSGMVKPVRMMT